MSGLFSPGDVISIKSDEEHSHGTAPATAIALIAIQDYLDGSAAGWMEQVNDE